jgi:hypothetical protein
MALPTPVGPSKSWLTQSPALRRERLLALPLAGLMALALVGCVGRRVSPSHRTIQEGGSSALHNLNRGRIGTRDKAGDLYD